MQRFSHQKIEEELPVPSEEALALSTELALEIIAEIREKGPMPFSRFFNLALYHPKLGYYTGPQAVFGEAGDFITAPLVSDLFSRSLANQVEEIKRLMQSSTKNSQVDTFDILEIGAGNGTMARDLLLALKVTKQLPTRYLILEVSPDLKARQRALIAESLPEYIDQVEWLDAPPQTAWNGVIIANEVLDALAVERFKIEDGQPHYIDVDIEIDEESRSVRFISQLRAADASLRQFYQSLLDKGYTLLEGTETEYCPTLESWLPPLFEHLEKGVALFIDYGYDEREYYRPERTTGTLIAHYKHRAHEDFYLYPGLQDLTANVNFTQVATLLVEMGLTFLGYTAQAYFLMGNGLQEMVKAEQEALAEKGDKNDIGWYELSQKVQQLVHPEEMGERFKVLAVGKNFDEALQGFALYDYAHHL
ncbi:SAM-dependent methyltransferase [Ignatzschineria indica]|uniref:SAM-dependent methyltransferase n=1 Tax=Ignatzschineria indica TaxID=472583 RepID=A0A2U2AIF0_9GAMM|nr:SAM-dependent methyltransferase [Ignatzschineria indica]PWD82434.1 hypothetical protein DC082_09150 [Ignatzschineria indica]GGZ83805.1 SAM-dependent methyltransferase [Ignatzschineria indica]